MVAAAAPPALEGITVLDFASVGPAARCSRILADYGAQVVKLGPPPKHGAKQIQPPFHSYGAGRGFKRAQIDLKAPEGKDAFLRLAAKADVVIESFRPGVVDRLAIGYADVRAVNDRIIYCSTSGYGQDGPSSKRAGHDLNYLALGGYLACTTPRGDDGPPIPGATVADSAAGGMHAAIAILAGLVRRQAVGRGEYLDVSVADGVLQLMSLHIDGYLATGNEPGPGSDILTGRYACYDSYRTGDGKWMSVGAIEPPFFANLCRRLGCEKWIEHQTDDAVQDEMRADFTRAFAERSRSEWVDAFATVDTCIAPVYTVAELVEDPQLNSRGVFVEAEHPEKGAFRQVGPVLAGTTRSTGPYLVPDPRVTDTDELLLAAGLSNDAIATMRDQGVIA
ncbi:MAG: CaiB/BaiF CoA-transferase family protein [Candidatus Binatia bacterium]